MDLTQFLALTLTGFGVAFLHAVIPTHWLAFVAIGRGRNWSRRRTLWAVSIAGGGHVFVTTGLGIALAWFGFEMNFHFSHVFHWAVAGLLFSVGAWTFVRSCFLVKGSHGKKRGNIDFKDDVIDKTVLLTLFLSLTLTPCGLLLPVYLTAVPYGWLGVLWLSGVLGLATLGGMLTLTWLTLSGLDRIKWRWLDRIDGRVIGGLLCLMGVATLLHSH